MSADLAMNADAGHSAVFAIVTGGGTSGHVLPALAIADALIAAGHSRDSIHYVGTTRGVETKLLPPTGLAHTLYDVSGLQRSLSRRNLMFLPRLVGSTWRARKLLKSLRPGVVVNVGGYASFPATFAARTLRIPTVIVSYDRRPGLVSRLLAKRATACAVAFADSPLPKAVHTGAPVRRELVELDRDAQRDAARAALDLPADRFVVAVVCGSLGAQKVNDVVVEAVERLAQRTDLCVYHVVGERFLESAAPQRDGGEGIMYRVIGYESRMQQLYAAADLLVTRAGAGTIAELATVGAPAIIVPWPGAAENHQLDNARTLSDIGAAVLVEQHDLTVDGLVAQIEHYVQSPATLRALADAAREAGAMHRSGALVGLIEEVASR
jgi:UDP-N-acetylglucosamine--N-acetylmuramyl-(pentapeptide) pyrophosphoryl-undecaprenol N-acetylglucosamine transferase